MGKVAIDKKVENIILFDGVCNLCNSAVNFVIDRDTHNVFKFSSLQSDFGQEYLKKNQLPTDQFDSMVFLSEGRTLTKSSAALNIAKELGGAWPLMYGFIIIPKFLRDAIYDLIANNRYKLFGRRDECRLPTPELKAKFLD